MLSNSKAIEILMNPKKVVFIGASSSPEKSSGLAIRNLMKSEFSGEILAMNKKGGMIDGKQLIDTIDKLPYGIDLAFITVPAKFTPQIILEIGKRGIKVAVVAVGGYAELGNREGIDLQQELIKAGMETGIRIIGPVCNGVYNTKNCLALGYNITHSKKLKKGTIGLLSHSGALLGPLVSAIEACGVGLSKFVSCGNEIDLCMTDYLEYLVDDKETNVIALVVDKVGNGKRFREILKKANRINKQIVALKLGETSVGKKVALAHSSHLAGSKEVYEAVFEAENVMRVFSLESLAIVCTILATGRKAKAKTITACSTSGGGAILLADRIVEQNIPLTALSEATISAITKSLRFKAKSILNPFDLGLGGRDYYNVNVENLAAEPETGVLICYGTQMQTASKRDQMARAFTNVANKFPKLPIVILFPGELEQEEVEIYSNSKVPVVTSIYEAIAIAKTLIRKDRKFIDEIDSVPKAPFGVIKKIDATPSGGLSEHGSKEILSAFGVKFPREKFVTNIETALEAANEIGYPVVLKACGKQLIHKSEHRLIELNLYSSEMLKKAWNGITKRIKNLLNAKIEGFLVSKMIQNGTEVIFGITKDDEFGHIAILGPGGVLAEMIGSSSMTRAPLPLNRKIIEEMVEKTPVKKLLDGYRGSTPGDKKALIEQIYYAAKAVESLGDKIDALDINPILVMKKGKGAWPLDALLIKN